MQKNPAMLFFDGKFVKLSGDINADIGDIVEIKLSKNSKIEKCNILVKSSGSLNAANLNILPQNYANTKKRFELIWKIRQFFHENGFIEAATAIMKNGIAPEEHIEPLSLKNGKFLIASPELSLKRLLVCGFDKLFEITHAFRNDAYGNFHNKEFIIAEWYRTYEKLSSIQEDFVKLLRYLTDSKEIIRQGKKIVLEDEIVTYNEAFKKAGFDLETLDSCFSDDEQCAKFNYYELVDYVFERYVKPLLGNGHITFLVNFPEWKSALAVVENRITRRFEVFIEGIEIASAFYELNDKSEQERRFKKENAALKKRGVNITTDEGFLDALGWGMPEASGIAVGIDRLLLFLTDRNKIEKLI